MDIKLPEPTAMTEKQIVAFGTELAFNMLTDFVRRKGVVLDQIQGFEYAPNVVKETFRQACKDVIETLKDNAMIRVEGLPVEGDMK